MSAYATSTSGYDGTCFMAFAGRGETAGQMVERFKVTTAAGAERSSTTDHGAATQKGACTEG